VAQFGLSQIPTDQALDILGDLLADTAVTQTAVAAVDWSILKPAYETRRERPFLAGVAALTPAVRAAAPVEESAVPALLARLEGVAGDERLDILTDYVQAEAASILGMSPANLDIHRGLMEMGMDSLMSVDLKTHLEKAVGLSLPSTLTFNYPTIAELSEYLNGRLTPAEPVAPSAAPAAAPSPAVAAEDMDDLSEDELEALLLKKLKGLK
ncbi:MAG: acyl carrier protein, partial [Anaerolineae bacterium]|nr:acyl carrier protein [Anaerolineae bacterium]